MPGRHLLDTHPELRVLVEKELVGGGEVGHPLLQLLQLGPQLQVLILTVDRKYLVRRTKNIFPLQLPATCSIWNACGGGPPCWPTILAMSTPPP